MSGHIHSFACTNHVQTRAEAVAHYKAKVGFVKKNIDSLQDALQTKQDNMNYLVNIMQVKMAQQQPA
jgi:prefoldin alpha subunit